MSSDAPLSAADAGVAIPCELFMDCRNASYYVGEGLAKCWRCRFAKANGGAMNMYRPQEMSPKVHPVEAEEKRQAKVERGKAKLAVRRAKNKPRQRVAKQAERAERGTEKAIIEATVNSGRRDQNLDHISRDRILLDTKSQSKHMHPVVDLHELDKARRQALAANYPVGGLVLVNKYGRRVVVFDVEDYAKVVR
jgi:hypothetical protein